MDSDSTQQVFLQWLSLCTNSTTSTRTERIAALSSLQSFLIVPTHVSLFIIPFLDQVWEMLQHCLFRPLSSAPKPQDTDVEDLGIVWSPETDPNWQEIKAVYAVFHTLVCSEDLEVKYLKQFMTPAFLRDFIALLDSPVQEEKREALIALHKLYAKVIPRRKLIRTILKETLQIATYEEIQFTGIAEILELQSAVASGFNVPLRQEHIDFFTQVLLPLYKSPHLDSFSSGLNHCMDQYIDKDAALVQPLLATLLRYWPCASPAKEVVFILTLNDVVLFQWRGSDLGSLVRKLTLRMCRIMLNLYARSVDHLLSHLESEGYMRLLKTYKETMYPLLIPVLVEQQSHYWHL